MDAAFGGMKVPCVANLIYRWNLLRQQGLLGAIRITGHRRSATMRREAVRSVSAGEGGETADAGEVGVGELEPVGREIVGEVVVYDTGAGG